LSAHAAGVSERLREIRNRLNLSQNEVASQMGIKRAGLVSYEDGRAPITFEFALRFCRQFVVSEEWLALGEKEILARLRSSPIGKKFKLGTRWNSSSARMCMSLISEPVCHNIPRKTLFFEAYNRYLDSVYRQLLEPRIYPRVLFSESVGDDLMRNYFHALLEIWLERMGTVQNKFRLLNSLAGFAERFERDINEDRLTEFERKGLIEEAKLLVKLSADDDDDSPKINAYVRNEASEYLARLLVGAGISVAENTKQDLTDAATSDKPSGVKSEWFKLKKKIQAATAEAGGKSKLADFLRVDLTQLSKWLTDSDSAREPGADYTLKMLSWVSDPKRQK
jgi:transcriptional regulator with XRE-family HTH domain